MMAGGNVVFARRDDGSSLQVDSLSIQSIGRGEADVLACHVVIAVFDDGDRVGFRRQFECEYWAHIKQSAKRDCQTRHGDINFH
jgi:hypothetical protein